MTGIVALVAVALLSWSYRVSFTAVLTGDRLPDGLRRRLDAVAPAAFGALLASEVASTSGEELPAVVAALLVAVLVGRRTGGHVAPVVAAAAVWTVVTAALRVG